MGKKESSQTIEEFLAKLDFNINVEPHLDEKVVDPNGFFRKAVTTAGLWKFVTARPQQILAKAVAEILLNLREGENSSTFTDPQDGKPVEVDLSTIADVFNLLEEGPDSLTDLELSVNVEYTRFATKEDEEFGDPKHNNIRTDLQIPFNHICKLYTKSVMCSIGSLGQLSDTKIFSVTVIVDSLIGTKFNWHGWFINQIHKVAKDFKFVKGSDDRILRKGKLKFFSRISNALENLLKNRRWTNMADYKKNTIFFDTYKIDKIPIDLGVVDVEVLPAAPVAERRSEAEEGKQAASPAKRAASKRATSKRPKKVRRVAALFEVSEAEVQPLEKEVEVDQPQPSPAKEQIIPQPSTTKIQIQTPPSQTPQEPQTSTTAQPLTQPPKQTSSQEEESTSFQIPNVPFLTTDLDAAFTLFTPAQTQPPQAAQTQAETVQASIPNSPTTSAETTDTTQTANT